jgi:hypothetical protein
MVRFCFFKFLAAVENIDALDGALERQAASDARPPVAYCL